MKKTYSFIGKYKKSFIFGAIIVVLLGFMVFGGGGAKVESYTVENSTIEQSVMLSGKVTTSDKADLGFADSGRIAMIYVKNNQAVNKGAILAQLEIGDLLADLRIKQAGSRTSNVDLQAAKDEVEKVTKQENTKVENAYRTLLTEDLELVPGSSSYNVDAPSLGGLYDGEPGQYKIRIMNDNANFDMEIATFNLETTRREINDEGSTPLGSKGLYISFPEDVTDYNETVWYVDIPNKSSSSYLSNLNAYNEAKDARDLAIKNAEADYEKLLAENDGGDSVAQAEIQKINAEIRKNTIYAPFSGKVTNIEKEVGENASVGERVISILGESKLEVVLQVSELDVSKLVPDSVISITLDAIPGETFSGILKTINSRETEIDGVPVYEAFVELASDARIKTGMNAKGLIILARKENVLAIPSYAITKEEGKNFVNVILEGGDTEKREVTLGLVGTDNMVEVISGLDIGEKIAVTAKK
jgi:RND family efflux transporter MFP subunit